MAVKAIPAMNKAKTLIEQIQERHGQFKEWPEIQGAEGMIENGISIQMNLLHQDRDTLLGLLRELVAAIGTHNCSGRDCIGIHKEWETASENRCSFCEIVRQAILKEQPNDQQ